MADWTPQMVHDALLKAPDIPDINERRQVMDFLLKKNRELHQQAGAAQAAKDKAAGLAPVQTRQMSEFEVYRNQLGKAGHELVTDPLKSLAGGAAEVPWALLWDAFAGGAGAEAERESFMSGEGWRAAGKAFQEKAGEYTYQPRTQSGTLAMETLADIVQAPGYLLRGSMNESNREARVQPEGATSVRMGHDPYSPEQIAAVSEIGDTLGQLLMPKVLGETGRAVGRAMPRIPIPRMLRGTRPAVDPSALDLTRRGVVIPPGHMKGGEAATHEKVMTSDPILGEFYRDAIRHGVESKQRADLNLALEHISGTNRPGAPSPPPSTAPPGAGGGAPGATPVPPTPGPRGAAPPAGPAPRGPATGSTYAPGRRPTGPGPRGPRGPGTTVEGSATAVPGGTQPSQRRLPPPGGNSATATLGSGLPKGPPRALEAPSWIRPRRQLPAPGAQNPRSFPVPRKGRLHAQGQVRPSTRFEQRGQSVHPRTAEIADAVRFQHALGQALVKARKEGRIDQQAFTDLWNEGKQLGQGAPKGEPSGELWGEKPQKIPENKAFNEYQQTIFQRRLALLHTVENARPSQPAVPMGSVLQDTGLAQNEPVAAARPSAAERTRMRYDQMITQARESGANASELAAMAQERDAAVTRLTNAQQDRPPAVTQAPPPEATPEPEGPPAVPDDRGTPRAGETFQQWADRLDRESRAPDIRPPGKPPPGGAGIIGEGGPRRFNPLGYLWWMLGIPEPGGTAVPPVGAQASARGGGRRAGGGGSPRNPRPSRTTQQALHRLARAVTGVQPGAYPPSPSAPRRARGGRITVPEHLSGHAAVDFAHGHLNDAFERAVQGVRGDYDAAPQGVPSLRDEVAHLRNMVNNSTWIPDAQMRGRLVLDEVERAFGPGGRISGRDLQNLLNRLGNYEDAYSRSQEPHIQDVAVMVREVEQGIARMIERVNPPDASQAYMNARHAWAIYKPAEAAAGSPAAGPSSQAAAAAAIGQGLSPGGVPTAQRYLNEVVRSSSAGSRAPRGRAGPQIPAATRRGSPVPLQQHAEEGRAVFGSQYPDSGTAGRGAFQHLISNPIHVTNLLKFFARPYFRHKYSVAQMRKFQRWAMSPNAQRYFRAHPETYARIAALAGAAIPVAAAGRDPSGKSDDQEASDIIRELGLAPSQTQDETRQP